MSQSKNLSERLTQMGADGKHLNDDSSGSEKILSEAMTELISYATHSFKPFGYTIVHEKTISLFDCQTFFEKAGGPTPNPENKKVCMKPDGGILYAISSIGDIRIPILIVEDNVQGTNDSLFEEGKKKQATGNAIERGAKNIRGAEMIFAGVDFFPYVMFASGCDFHDTETIAKRLEMMNMGVPNHYIDITPTTSPDHIQSTIDIIISSININKLAGKSIASIFVKAHKWNEMKHGASSWTKNERLLIMKKVIDKVIQQLALTRP